MKFVPPTKWTAGAFVLALAAASFISRQMYANDLSATTWRAPARAARKINPISPDAASIRAGHAIYADQCLCCHGSAGKGDGPSACDLTPKPDDLSCASARTETDGSLFWKITTGREPMPAFDTTLADTDRWNVINFIRTLQPKPTTVASTQESPQASSN